MGTGSAVEVVGLVELGDDFVGLVLGLGGEEHGRLLEGVAAIHEPNRSPHLHPALGQTLPTFPGHHIDPARAENQALREELGVRLVVARLADEENRDLAGRVLDKGEQSIHLFRISDGGVAIGLGTNEMPHHRLPGEEPRGDVLTAIADTNTRRYLDLHTTTPHRAGLNLVTGFIVRSHEAPHPLRIHCGLGTVQPRRLAEGVTSRLDDRLSATERAVLTIGAEALGRAQLAAVRSDPAAVGEVVPGRDRRRAVDVSDRAGTDGVGLLEA